MDLSLLFYFIPLLAAAFIVYHLIFKVQLPSKGIWAIISYIIGAVIIFIIVGYLISAYLGSWMNDMLAAGSQPAWTTFIESSEDIVEGAFGASGDPNSGGGAPAATPTTPSIIIITATPIYVDGGGNSAAGAATAVPPGTATTHTVQTGDTLYSISATYGVPVDDIMVANGLTSYTIITGQVLQIPAP